MATLTLDGVSKVFDRHTAVDDLTLEAGDGEFLVLVGPSGCGKTTALRMIAGLEHPSAGRIRIGDRDVTGIPPGERNIAMVFQNYALYPHLTVFQNLSFPLEMQKWAKPEIERAVRAAAGVLELDGVLERRPGQLSGGQRQRVALGRALVREPAVFLFDEPLSNLDAQLRVQTRAELARLHRRLGTTMVYVTHDQTEAMTLGARIAVMHGGRLQQVAPPLEVYDRPANRFVARFIGSPPMNVFEGEVRTVDGTSRFDGPALACALPLRAAAGRCVLGIRPEHVVVHADGPIALTVDMVEPLGAETHVAGTAAGGELVVARLPRRHAPRPGDVVRLGFDAAHVHLFAADDDGRRLAVEGEPT
jgi:multiple sugar transport system ATP-binding protein